MLEIVCGCKQARCCHCDQLCRPFKYTSTSPIHNSSSPCVPSATPQPTQLPRPVQDHRSLKSLNLNFSLLDTPEDHSRWVPSFLAYVPLLTCPSTYASTSADCPQIQSVFRAIGSCLMAIVNAIGSVLHAIINGIVTVFDVIISCLTCGYCGRKRRGRSVV